MRLLITRHGLTEENVQNICQGQLHGHLTSEGINESHLLAARLKEVSIDACYSSDLERAWVTATNVCAPHAGLAPISDVRLRERYFGTYQGQKFPEHGTYDFPDLSQIEPLEAIQSRLQSFLLMLTARHNEDETILVVSHGFTLRLLIKVLTDRLDMEVEELPIFGNTSLTIAHFMPQWPAEIELLNDCSHTIEVVK